MRQLIPDAESITEFFGEYEALGYQIELVSAPQLGGYALRMPLGPNDEVTPVFPLPAAEMQTPEDAQRWMEYLRDHQLSQFAFLLERREAVPMGKQVPSAQLSVPLLTSFSAA